MNCNHKWATYQGFTDTFEYCTGPCGAKRGEEKPYVEEMKILLGQDALDAWKAAVANKLTIEERIMTELNNQAAHGLKPIGLHIHWKDFDELEKILGQRITSSGASYSHLELSSPWGQLIVRPSGYPNWQWIYV